jgi:hypothetical protein
VRSALATGLNVNEDSISIDYGAKIVTVDCDPPVTMDAIAKALESSEKYGVVN